MPSNYLSDKHDIGFLRADRTTQVGFMLAQDKGVPLYQEFDDEYLAQQFFTGVPGYGSLPSEKEIAIRQDDWRSGLGLEVYDADEPKRYYQSGIKAADARFRGRIMAGPLGGSIAKTSLTATEYVYTPPTSNTANGWSDPTYAYDDARTSKASYDVPGNSDSGYLVLSIASSAIKKLRYFATRETSEITGTLEVLIDTTWTAYGGPITFDAWTYVTCDATVLGARFLMHNGNSLEARFAYVNEFDFYKETASQAVTAAAIATHAEFNDLLYMGMGVALIKLNGTGDGFTPIGILPAAITALQVFPDGNLYIFLGTSNAYWYMSTAEAFTECTDDNRKFQYAGVDFAASPTMWANDAANTIKSTTNPTNPSDPTVSNWAGATTVGASYHAITSLTSFDGSIHIGKEDMMYYLDSSGNVKNDIAPDLSVLTASTNYKLMMIWLAKLYMPVGIQGLLERDTSGVNTWRSPSDFCTGLSEYSGQIEALAGDERYFFCAVKDASANYRNILAGRLETIDGSTSWSWHHFISFSDSNALSSIWVSSVYKKRLWYSPNSTGSLWYYWLPTNYGDITTDADRNFASGGEIITPYLHGNFKDTKKAFTSVEAELGHAYDVDIYIQCQYQKLEDTAWTNIGNLDGLSTDRRDILYLPKTAGDKYPVSTMMRLKFIAITDDATKTPVLLSYKLTALLYPDQRKIIACTVRVCNEKILKDGTRDEGSQPTEIAVLDEARAATWPVSFYDIDGATQYVKFLPLPSGTPRWRVIKDEKGRVQERHYNLFLQVVSLS